MTRETDEVIPQLPSGRVCSLSPKAEGKTTSESWEDMRSNDSCSGWATQPTATDSAIKGA